MAAGEITEGQWASISFNTAGLEYTTELEERSRDTDINKRERKGERERVWRRS